MIDSELCEMIIEKYYRNVYNFCVSQLKNREAAEDCTQETFVVFFRKRDKLYLTDSILSWLFSTAMNVIKDYRRSNSTDADDIDLLAEKIADETDIENKPLDVLYDNLSREEAELLIEYFSCSRDERVKMAERYGLSVPALYKKISRIRAKLLERLGK